MERGDEAGRRGRIANLFGITAQLTQHGAGLDRSELVLVAEQHDSCAGRQRVEQRRHHLEMDHRCFVDDKHVHLERMSGVVSKAARVRSRTKQRMQCPGCTQRGRESRESDGLAESLLQADERGIDGLLQPGGCLPGRRRQREAQRLALRR